MAYVGDNMVEYRGDGIPAYSKIVPNLESGGSATPPRYYRKSGRSFLWSCHLSKHIQEQFRFPVVGLQQDWTATYQANLVDAPLNYVNKIIINKGII